MYRKYNRRRHVQRLIQHEAKPSAVYLETPTWGVYFSYTISALSDILYSLVIFHGVIFSSTQTAVIYSDQAVSTGCKSWFLVIETIFRISLAIVLAIYNVTHVINCLNRNASWSDGQMISKCLYNLFLAVEWIHRVNRADFSDLLVLFIFVFT